ncbi:hypothetical protein [Akkermansia massiliensis]|uniref:hypothetical protein n=1 Tax=Akkermansia massiliensis TaxID=2927224 RepID=UPI00202F9F1B|nr:hypothetical protein [Akkermansia sp. B2-R-115]MCM0686207.1 hypothetical protein [Akkermansia sp. B2-R-115]
MKNILIILFTISCTSVSLFATESMPLMTVAAEKNRSSMQSIRLHGLKDLENTSFHFGSKKLTDQAPDLKKILHGLKVRNGIFFVTSDSWNPILYCNQHGHINGSMDVRYSTSVFGIRTDMIIFEGASFNYWSMPSIYKEIVLSDDCWVMTKGDDILCFTFKNAGLAFKGFTDPATFVTPETVKTRYASTREMLPVLKALSLVLDGKAPAVYDFDLAQEKLMEFNRSIKQRDRRAREVSKLRWQKEEKQREERKKLAPDYGIPGKFPFSVRGESDLSEGLKWKNFDTYFSSLSLSPDKKVILPNPDQGAVNQAWLKTVWKKGDVDVVDEQENGVVARLHTEGKDDDKSDIWLFVGYCQSQSAAMNELYSRRFQKTPDRPEQWSWDDEIATVVVNPFKLGDYSLGRQGVLGDFGGIIPSSNESSLFFVNGNTVVALVSMDPSCSVLSLAEQIDKRLEAVRKNK